MATTKSHKEFMAQLDDLDRAAVKREHTESELSTAFDHVYDDGDYIDRNIGVQWIYKNPFMFGRVVDDPEAFLRSRFDVPNCMELLLVSKGLLEQIPAEKRESFVYDAYVKCGARNNGWIDAALSVGVSRNMIAKAILEKLRETEVRDLVAHAIYDFLESGAGANLTVYNLDDAFPGDDGELFQFNAKAPWAMFEGNTIREVFEMCAVMDPKRTLMAGIWIARRLGGWKSVMPILKMAADRLTNLHHQELFVLERLPIEVGVKLAERIVLDRYGNDVEITIKFLISTYQAMNESRRSDFRKSVMKPLFDQMNWGTLCRQTRGKLDANHDAYLENRIREDGFIIDSVRSGKYRGRVQFEVNTTIDGKPHRFVQDRHQHRFLPKIGERVAIKPSAAKALNTHGTLKIYAAIFVPLERNSTDYD